MTNKLFRIVLAIALLASVSLAVPSRASAQVLYSDPNPYVNYIIQKESSGRAWVKNPIGCAGLMQRCPGSILEAACPNWQNDIPCQIQHFTDYAIGRYGSWERAYWFHVIKGWW